MSFSLTSLNKRPNSISLSARRPARYEKTWYIRKACLLETLRILNETFPFAFHFESIAYTVSIVDCVMCCFLGAANWRNRQSTSHIGMFPWPETDRSLTAKLAQAGFIRYDTERVA